MRLLVRAPNWLGDIVMALPAIAGIRRHFSSDTLAVAVPTDLARVFSAVPGVDAIVPLGGARGELGSRAWREHAQIIASGRFDTVILFPNSFHAAWVAKRARVPERWGYRTDLRGWLLTKAVRRPRRRRGEVRHQAEYFQDLVRGLGIDPVPPDPRVTVSLDLRARAGELLERHGGDPPAIIIGIAPGAAYGHAKRWPPDRFAELIAMLRRELDATCVLVGSTGDRDAGYAIESWLASARQAAGSSSGSAPRGRVVNLIGRTDLLMLMGVLACCRVVVSNDSGAMHLAAALGLPVTAVFGPTDERATAPLGHHQILTNPVWCRPCMLRECPIDHRCMTRVSARSVFEAMAQQIQELTAGTRAG